MADLTEIAAERAEAVMFPQADLLGLPPIPATRPDVERRAKAGRPPGARNKRQEEVARYIAETFGDPLLHQAAIATMSTEELAARLGCTLLDAAVEKRLAAVAVLPYLHSRQPVQVDLRNHQAVSLTINLSTPGAAGSSSTTIEATAVDMQEYQMVSGGDDAAV